MRYVLSSFKGERKRGLEGCMEDAIYMFRSLYILNKEIFNWKKRGQSRSKAKENNFIDWEDRGNVRALLLSGVNKKDSDKSEIPQLGFRIGLWNGLSQEDKSASLSFLNGCYSPRISNSFVLKFSDSESFILDRELKINLINIAVNFMEADVALLHEEAANIENYPFLDIAIYLNDKFDVDKKRLDKIQKESQETIRCDSGKIYLA